MERMSAHVHRRLASPGASALARSLGAVVAIVAAAGGCGDDGGAAADAADADAAAGCAGGQRDLAVPADAPYGLVLTPTHLYWTTAILDGDKGVWRLDRRGGGPERVATSRLEIGVVTVDEGGRPYWIEAAPSKPGGGAVMTLDDADQPRVLYTIPPGDWLDAFALVVDADRVYWLTHDLATFTDRLMAAPRAGQGTPAMLGSAAVPFATTTRRMRADADALYWGYAGGQVFRAPRAGGRTDTVVASADGLGDFVLAAGGLFFINRDAGGSLRRVDALGGAPTLVAADVGARFALEAHHDHLVATSNDDRILAVPLAGGTPLTVVDGDVGSAAGLAVDDLEVFWATTAIAAAGGAVRATCTPSALAGGR
jgi:hypothetical protein